MFIKNISFLNVRKISQYNENFLPETNIIIGPNGSGKTSILEAICFLTTGKSFRKKHAQSIIKKGEKELQIQAKIINKEEKKLRLVYSGKKKQIYKNNKIIKTTTSLLKETSLIYASPEEVDIIEEYRKEKQQYFDKIIFKINPEHIQNIKEYNKILLYRNALLEQKMSTLPWDDKTIDMGIKVWKKRTAFFKEFIIKFNETQKRIKTLQNYKIEYKKKEPTSAQNYKTELKGDQKKTETGPHKDNIELYLDNEKIKEHGSQGEKKILKYILKITEAELIKQKKTEKPIILLDDFFSKLDNENIMKIFSYFHCKFQVIITTTNTNDQALKNIRKNNKEIKIFNNK